LNDHLSGKHNHKIFVWSFLNLGNLIIELIKMIPHSQPFIKTNTMGAIKNLLRTKTLQSDSAHLQIQKAIKEKFFLKNFSFTQSGTHALYWILKGLQLQKDEEVILPTYVCKSVYNAILAAGVKPVLCDIGLFWHASPKNIEAKITSKTKAIIIVNLFGMHLDCSQFRFPGIILINDLCQSLDILRYQNWQDHGDFVFFSFHPTKFITAGAGGGFSQLNPNISFQNLLSSELLDSPMCDLNAAILLDQLAQYDEIIEKRKTIANYYFSQLDPIYTKYIPKENNSYFRFPIIQDLYDFEYLRSCFAKRKISVRHGVDRLIHRDIGLSDSEFPNCKWQRNNAPVESGALS